MNRESLSPNEIQMLIEMTLANIKDDRVMLKHYKQDLRKAQDAINRYNIKEKTSKMLYYGLNEWKDSHPDSIFVSATLVSRYHPTLLIDSYIQTIETMLFPAGTTDMEIDKALAERCRQYDKVGEHYINVMNGKDGICMFAKHRKRWEDTPEMADVKEYIEKYHVKTYCAHHTGLWVVQDELYDAADKEGLSVYEPESESMRLTRIERKIRQIPINAEEFKIKTSWSTFSRSIYRPAK